MASRLPVVNKLLYTADLVGTQAMAQSRHLWLLFFLAPPVDEGTASAVPAVSVGPLDIDPRVFIGIVLTAGRVIEAIDDPIVGWWSDRTRSRWGRRIPFILFGTPFYAFFFALLWLTPWGDSNYLNAIYLFVVLELFFLATTLTGGPYEALLPEIAPGHRDRMSIVAWQFYFGIAGAVAGLVLSGLIKDQFGFFAMGSIFALMALASRYAGLGGVWRHAPRETPAADIELGAAFTATLRNKQFLYFLPTFVFYQLAVSMVISWLPFFVTAVLERENEGAVTSMLTAVALSAMVLSAFGRCGSWATARASGGSTRLACSARRSTCRSSFFAGFLPIAPKLAQGIAFAFLAGIPMAGVNLLPRAITADITDYDHIRTGMRREGVFYATQNLFEKIGSSFSPLALAIVLKLGDTTANPLGLRMVGPVAGAVAFLGYWLFRGYRLPSTVTPETVREAGL